MRDGILNHSKTRARILEEDWGEAGTLEGDVCRLSDVVAYVNHDTDDAIRAGVITEGDLPLSAVRVLGLSRSARINTLVSDIIEHSWSVRVDTPSDSRPAVGMSAPVLEATNTLREFLFTRVYDVHSGQEEADQAKEIVHRLYEFFSEHADKLPPEYRLGDEGHQRQVVDYIAGMTDRYALRTAEEMSLVDARARQQRLFTDS